MRGIVTLVGAGPGDVGLLTIKGLQAIKQADVVVYDRLVSSAILALIPETAKMIDVGKKASNHKVPQEQINKILLDQAQLGKNVVRLKGGDSFLFGRGGEELELLSQHGINFEVVPGITSAIAAPAYGGIPVTHRDFCSSVHIITGHARAGKALDIDFESLIKTKGTLVFLMGVTALSSIVSGLENGGMDLSTKASIIENGTTPKQRRIDGTIATIHQLAIEAKVQSPAIIVVGEVCGLAKDFCWFDKLALRGKSILVTRPKERSGTLSNKLRALGADVSEYPCIETIALNPCPKLEEVIGRFSEFNWLVFTSPAGVDFFWNTLEQHGLDGRALGKIKVAVIGMGTAKALKNHGIIADFIPEIYDAEHLGMGLFKIAQGGKILILRALEGSPLLTKELKNIPYEDISIYRTIYQNPQSESLRKKLDNGELEWVTFTSASTVKGFVSSLGDGADFSKITGICIGKQTAQEARKYGISVKIAEQATVNSMVEIMEKISRVKP